MAICNISILNLVFMALLEALCWELIFIIRIRFPPAMHVSGYSKEQ